MPRNAIRPPSVILTRRTMLGAVGLSTAGLAFGDWTLHASSAQASVLGRGSASPTGLADLIIDQVGRLEPSFDPSITRYRATAYRSVDTLTMRATTVGGAIATINGKTPDSRQHDRVTVPLKLGVNTITVAVTKGASTTAYTLEVTKVQTDYRGREAVPYTASTLVGEADGHPLSALSDGNLQNYWAPAEPIKAGPGGDPGVTAVVLDLGAARQVGLVSGRVTVPAGQWYPDYADGTVGIEVSADQQTWTEVSRQGVLRQDQGLVYWDFGRYVEGRYVRVSLARMDDRIADLFGFNELVVMALPVGTAPPQRFAPPADGAQSHAFAPQGLPIGRAQELALHHGLLVAMWAPSGGFMAGAMDTREYADLQSLTAQFYDPPLEDLDFMAYNPQATWGIAKAPAGGNGIGQAGAPHEFLPEKMKPYASRMIDLQYGDEGGYSTGEVESFRTWFEFSRATYPQAITHSNQNNNAPWATNFSYYVKTAKPDLASFDHYFWWSGVGPAHWEATSNLLGTNMWKAQRQAALEGLTGDGTKPILFGQYLDGCNTNGSESQKAIVTSLSLASGMKWLSVFRMEMNRFDGSFYFDVDGAPTRAYWEAAELLHQVRTLGRYLVALNNRWLAVAPGSHLTSTGVTANPVASGWHLDSAARSSNQLAAWGINSVTAVNRGTVNDGLPGDVAIGLFDTLPGLDSSVASQLFGTAQPRAFLLTNGLIGVADFATQHDVRYDDGQYWQTAQEITVEVVPPPEGALYRVDPISGQRSRVALTKEVTGPSKNKVTRYYFTTTIGGGLCELFYWTTASVRVDSGPTLDIAQGATATVTVTITNEASTESKQLTVAPSASDGWSVTYSGPSKLGALPPGGSVTFSVTIGNRSTIGPATIPLGLTFGSTPLAGGVQVTGVPGGTLIRPSVVAVDSEETTGENGRGVNAVDGDTGTIWHTEWYTKQPAFPHWIVVDLGASRTPTAVSVLPRQNAASQRMKNWQIFVSDDPASFPATPVASGQTRNEGTRQVLPLPTTTGRYLKLVGLDEWAGTPYLAIAELGVYVR